MLELLDDHSTSYLPPPEFRLIAPGERIPTPVDERGLVDIPGLFAAIKETIDPEFEWSSRNDVHHLYWPKSAYPIVRGRGIYSNPHYFRNQSTQKALIPIQFHAWLHKVTVPPPVPSDDVIAYRIEAWRTAHSLFQAVKKSRRWERRAERRRADIACGAVVLRDEFSGEDVIGEEFLRSELERYFNTCQKTRQRISCIPPEFRIIDPDKPMDELTKDLGKLVARPSLTLVRLAAI